MGHNKTQQATFFDSPEKKKKKKNLILTWCYWHKFFYFLLEIFIITKMVDLGWWTLVLQPQIAILHFQNIKNPLYPGVYI